MKDGDKRFKKGEINPEWMKLVIKAFEEVGEEEIIDLIKKGKEIEVIEKKMKGAVNIELEQEIEGIE